MDREELFLKQKFGNERPFRVPEGYFDSFADNLMKELPEREANEAKVVPMRRRLSWRKFATVAPQVCSRQPQAMRPSTRWPTMP